MSRHTFFVVMISVLTLYLAGCAWKPEVTAVPITAPWIEMNLPVKQDAVVWASEDKQLKAVHKADKKVVMESYIEALKAQGWTLGKFEGGGEEPYFAELEKAGEKIKLEVYDFDNTGVIIEKVAGESAAPTPAPTP